MKHERGRNINGGNVFLLGTIVNALAVICGGAIGLLLRKGLPERVQYIVMQGIGLAVLAIGVKMSLETKNVLIVIFSIVIGGLLGEAINIEGKLNSWGRWLEKRTGGSGGDFTKAFVTTSLIYCVGAMAVLGAIEDGLTGKPTILYAKSMLDGVSAIIFASTMGWGVLFSSLPIFCYQGTITLLAGFLRDIVQGTVINELTATGGLLIIGIAMNIMQVTKIKIGNMLPAIIVAIILAYITNNYIPAYGGR